MGGRLAVGLDSVVEILARERGVTEDQARAILAQNRADNLGSLGGVTRVGSAVPAAASGISADALIVDATSATAGREGPQKKSFVAGLRERLAAKAAEGGGNTP